MVTGATEALLLLLNWDGSRLQWAVEQSGRCLSAGEEMAVGAEQALEAIQSLQGKGLRADEVLWSNRHPNFCLVPDLVDGEAAFALEHGLVSGQGALRCSKSNRFGDPLACWEQSHEVVESAVLKAWPMTRIVSGTMATLEAMARREMNEQRSVVYLDVSPGRSFWARWNAGQLRGAMASGERIGENMLYQIANALHRDGTDPSETELVVSGEDLAQTLELFGRFFKSVSELDPFRPWGNEEMKLKEARWASLWNLALCAL